MIKRTTRSHLDSLHSCLVDGLDQNVEGRALCQGRVELLVEGVVMSALKSGNVRDTRRAGSRQANLVVMDTAVGVTSGPVQKQLKEHMLELDSTT